MNSERSDYFILRNGNTHGPCSIDEIRSYLTYGSMRPSDMVSPAGRTEWSPASVVLASVKELDEPGSAETDHWFIRLRFVFRRTLQQLLGGTQENALGLEVRRRVVRFREWEKVPVQIRGTNVAWRIATGFFFNPPRLWAACAQVFATRVFRRAADEAGYLKTWPKSMETLCACLIVLNTICWGVLMFALADRAVPVVNVAGRIVAEACRELRNG